MMKLSEAIRLGAMATDPVHGPMFDERGGRICATCAIGAPMFALFGHRARQVVDGSTDRIALLLAERWPWVQHAYDRGALSLVGEMVCRFENHRWTREQIADWIETIEPQDDPAADARRVAEACVDAALREKKDQEVDPRGHDI